MKECETRRDGKGVRGSVRGNEREKEGRGLGRGTIGACWVQARNGKAV
jgi:hypothetical protein